MPHHRRLRPLLLVLLACIAGPALAQDGVRREQVRFPPGASGTTVEGSLRGRDYVLYMIGAEAGQRMTIRLRSPHPGLYFNVYEPGRGPGDQALAIGGTLSSMVPDLNRFDATLPASGTYTVSVYLVRAAARRGERARYTLEIAIPAARPVEQRPPVRGDFADGLQGGPDFWEVTLRRPGATANLRRAPSAGAPVVRRIASGTIVRNLGCRMAEAQRWCRVELRDRLGTSGWMAGELLREASAPPAAGRDARVPGTRFHATGTIPCARYAGQPMGQCRFGVVRGGGGNGTVTVFWPDGGSRAIGFEAGTPATHDGPAARMTTANNAGLFTVTIGDERFEIPDAVISGG